ncbi:MAG: NAD-reducing hydrogenase HoxS subunit beta [Anaerolineae bacterium]|nr:NAD-reducing hydrogenase HoxS subunit beta [Anaerolineae bacterium]
MGKTILIDPVTRIEGHSKITIQLDERGAVADARFHVTQMRGFEKLVQGRPFHEMPSLMARICGICPVSHLMASAKACDALLAVQIPDAADKLRRIMNLAQIVQSHALSFFYLSAPDLLLGMDADPARRNIVGLLQEKPELARDGIRLRQFGQQTIELLGGRRIHPGWVVPGGVNEPLDAAKRDEILQALPETLALAERTLQWFKPLVENYRKEIRAFANFPSLFVGLVGAQDNLSFYDGALRVMDARGKIIADKIQAEDYAQYIGEAVEPDSYLKSAYYKPFGYPQGIYRVGPLARLNIVSTCETPRANREWAEFRELQRGPVLSSFHYHYARLVEILYALERMELLLADPAILSRHVRAYAAPNNYEGVGMSEAPRGTLIHHYKIDANGLMEWANLIIATGHNNLAMNQGVLQTAQHFVHGERLTDGALNRVEAVIRAYDPCLSCSTHAFGQMPLQVQLVNVKGELLDEKMRG